MVKSFVSWFVLFFFFSHVHLTLCQWIMVSAYHRRAAGLGETCILAVTWIFTVFPSLLYTNCILTVSSLYSHCNLTVSLYPHCIFIISSLYLHCILIVYSLYPQNSLILSSMYPHCILIVTVSWLSIATSIIPERLLLCVLVRFV